MSCFQVTHFLRKLRGGSQPILVEAEDGRLYVAKFADNLQGTNLPFNESMGAELYRACGLNVPEWKPLLLSDDFVDRNPGCWMETEVGLRRPAAGLCFGSLYLGSSPERVHEFLPAAAFLRICNRADFWLAWLIDVCAGHTDNRQALHLEGASGELLAYFIDHGHLFGGAGSGCNVGAHLAASRYLDPCIYAPLSPGQTKTLLRRFDGFDLERVWRRLAAVPQEWQSPSALHSLERALHRLTDRALRSNLLDELGRLLRASQAARRPAATLNGLPIFANYPRAFPAAC